MDVARIKLGMEQSYCSVQELYDRVAEVLGWERTEGMCYDCTEIKVARNIQDNVFAYYDYEKDLPEYDRAVIWACYGPRVDSSLADDEVEVTEMFIATEVRD